MNARLLLLLGFAAILTARGGPDVQYFAYNLGSLGGNVWDAYINNSGLIAGYGYSSSAGGDRGFLYANNAFTTLPTLGGANMVVNGLNNLGQVVGGFSGVNGHAFVYSNGTLTDLGTFGATSSSVTAINDSGQLAGYTRDASGTAQAFLYSSGTFTNLGTLGGNSSIAEGINNAGVVVGFSGISLTTQESHAFSYSTGALHDIGTLGGSSSFANAINDAGQIVGDAETPLNAKENAFLYSGGTMVDLGSLGGWSSSAFDINNSAQIVGSGELTPGGQRDAFIYQNNALVDLNTITDLSGTNFSYLMTATSINDSGYIVGAGMTTGGARQLFLLAPISLTAVPEPATTTLGFAGALIAVAAGLRWRNRSALPVS